MVFDGGLEFSTTGRMFEKSIKIIRIYYQKFVFICWRFRAGWSVKTKKAIQENMLIFQKDTGPFQE